jgi:hypothetical protein
MRNLIRTTLIAAGFTTLGFAGPAFAAEPAKNLVSPAFGTFAVTEQGPGQWQVCWQAQAKPQRFSGSLHSAGDSEIVAKVSLRGVAVMQMAANRVTFDAAADAHEKQCLDVEVQGDHEQLLVDLAINDVGATNPYLVFSTDAASDALLALRD